MAVDTEITLRIVEQELASAKRIGERFGWEFTPIEEEVPLFTVAMDSTVDDQMYHLEFRLDDYKELPPYIEFFDPSTGQRGTKACYPQDRSQGDGSLFHATPCICHPCCRKAYGRHGGPHNDWDGQISNWQNIAGNITDLSAMLLMIQARMNDPEHYQGRMAE